MIWRTQLTDDDLFWELGMTATTRWLLFIIVVLLSLLLLSRSPIRHDGVSLIMSCNDVVSSASLCLFKNVDVCGRPHRRVRIHWLRGVCTNEDRLNYSDHVPRKLNNFRGISQLLLFVNFFYHYTSILWASCCSRSSRLMFSLCVEWCVCCVVFFRISFLYFARR